MSSKSSRKGRRGRPSTKCKDNDSSEGSQVFVLPPELLEKLGINLCAIQNDGEGSSSSDTKIKETRKSKKRNGVPNESPQKSSKYTEEIKNAPAKTDETSMLETASLMKQSVFLSPTFIPEISATSIVNAEIEFSCPMKEQIKKSDLISVNLSTEDNRKENIKKSSDTTDPLPPTLQADKTESCKIKGDINKKNNDGDNNSYKEELKSSICESQKYNLKKTDSFKDDKILTNQITDLEVLNVDKSGFRKEEISIANIESKECNTIKLISEEEATVNGVTETFVSDLDQITSDAEITSKPVEYRNIPIFLKEKDVDAIGENDNNDQNLKSASVIQYNDQNGPSSNAVSPEQCHSHISYDDHLDEAYMSDCSNSNIGTGLILDIVNNLAESSFDKVVTDIENKVNILSEEIIDEARFNELVQKTLFSPKRDLVPVSINDIVKINQKYCTYESDFHSNVSQNTTVTNSNMEEISSNHIDNATHFFITPEIINSVEDIVSPNMNNSYSGNKISEHSNPDGTQVHIEFIDETGVVIQQPTDNTPKNVSYHERFLQEGQVEILNNVIYENHDINPMISNERTKSHCKNNSIDMDIIDDMDMEINQHRPTDSKPKNPGHETTQQIIQIKNPQQSEITNELDNLKNNAVDLMVKHEINAFKDNGNGNSIIDTVHINLKNNQENVTSQLKGDNSHSQHDANNDAINELKLNDEFNNKIGDSLQNEVELLPEINKWLPAIENKDEKEKERSEVLPKTNICLPTIENKDERKKERSEALPKMNKCLPTIDNKNKKEEKRSDNQNTDQLQEIAFYLEKCAHILTKRRKSNIPLHNSNQNKTTEKKIRNDLKLNCNEEGVEKPGGVPTQNKNLNETKTKQYNIKSYSRSSKHPRTVTIYRCANTSSDNELEAISLKVTNKADVTISQEFCVCNDFGSISPPIDFHAMDIHVHFQDKMSIGYNDNIFTELDYVEYVEKSLALGFIPNTEIRISPSENNRSICWNVIEKQIRNTESENSNITQLKQASEITNEINMESSKSETSSIKGEITPSKNTEVILDITDFHRTNQNNMKLVEIEMAAISTPYVQEQLIDHIEVGLVEEQNKNDEPVCNTKKSISLNINADPATSKLKMKRKRSDRNDQIKKELEEVGEKVEDVEENTNSVELGTSNRKLSYICGACHESVESTEWLEHLVSHNYIAWKDGDPPLDPNREGDVREHLGRILQQYGWLKCLKCGVLYDTKLQLFIKHVKKCKPPVSPVVKKAESKLRLSSDSDDDKPLAKRARKSVIPIVSSGEEDDDDKPIRPTRTSRLSTMSINETDSEKPTVKKRGHPKSKITNKSAENDHVIPNDFETKEKDDDKDEHDKPTKSQRTSRLSTISKDETVNETPKVKKTGRPKSKLPDENVDNNDFIQSSKGIDTKERDDKEDERNNLTKSRMSTISKDEKVNETPKVKKRGRPKSKLPDENVDNNDFIQSSKGIDTKERDDKEDERNNLTKSRLSTFSNDETFNETPKVKKRGRPKSKPLSDHDERIESPNDIDKKEKYIDEDQLANNKLTKSRRTSRLSTISKDETDNENPKVKKRGRPKSKLPNENKDDIDRIEKETEINDEVKTTKCDQTPTNLEKNKTHKIVECGVCRKEVKKYDWTDHIMKEHNYLAWQAGKKPVDLDNPIDVQDHLIAISQKNKGLTCHKCGTVRKYPKVYLQHVQNCECKYLDSSLLALDTSVGDNSISGPVDENSVTCALCGQFVKRTKWHEHAMSKHYNIAWIVGGVPFDLRNPAAAERALKEYKLRYKSFVCKVCGAGRASAVGFYAHILVCGKPEEEVEKFKDTCDVCNQKYLCIYKQQHLMVHKEKELSIQRRQLQLELAEKAQQEASEPPPTDGRRRAAEKARTVIENYKNEKSQYKWNCPTCEFATDSQTEMEQHACRGAGSDGSDGDVSPDSNTDEETDDSDVDSDLSEREHQDQEQEVIRKKKKKKYSYEPVSRHKSLQIPFKVRDPKSYLRQSDADFIQLHYTTERLFTEWVRCSYEPVPEGEVTTYMPLLNESCKVRVENDDWETLKRFEAKSGKVTRLFTGAVPQCVAWAPPRYRTRHASADRSFLAVACHSAKDLPRYASDSTHEHPNTVQIWDFGTFADDVPKLSFIIAHDHGVVWSMAWCPSGARDGLPHDANETDNKKETPSNDDTEALTKPEVLPGDAMEATRENPSDNTEEDTIARQKSQVLNTTEVRDGNSEAKKEGLPDDAMEAKARDEGQCTDSTGPTARLGLLAVACSNGRAYIYAVPIPATMPVIDKLFYKLKPVAELRLNRNTNAESRRQCSSIAWSAQKGHATISAGYTDGTVALYNLTCTSPLGTCEEDGVTIIYPYHDEKTHNNCVTGVSIYPSADEAADVGVLLSASTTGAALVAAGRAGRGAGRGVPAAAAFQPHWPVAMLPDDSLSISEFDWFGGSRRLGVARLFTGCARCGVVVSSQPPLMRKFIPHPVYKEMTKTNVMLVDMAPLSGKKRTRANTETEMYVEPLDYDAATDQYGLQLSFMRKKELLSSLLEPRPERFPLSDVLSMAFCPAPRHHHMLAAATQSGVVLLINIT